MATTLYPLIRDALFSLAQSVSTLREPEFAHRPLPPSLAPLASDSLRSQVQAIWDSSSAAAGYVASTASEDTEGEGKENSEGSSSGVSAKSRKAEIVRSVLELVGRDLVVTPIIDKQVVEPEDATDAETATRFQTALQDRLDIALTLYEVVYDAFSDVLLLEPGAIFIPLLEDLVELISQSSWYELWTYVETRSKRFTKDMPASKGKALPLLRTINAFLRTLPRTPEGLVFRGRVHQFASSVIGIADKSAINMRGDYNDIKTTWEEEPSVEESKGETGEGEAKEEGDGDVNMEEAKVDEAVVEGESKAKAESEFYSTLWSLQQYFSNPPSLDGPAVSAGKEGEEARTPFDQFRAKTDFLLPKLYEQTKRERELRGKETDSAGEVGKKRKRDETGDNEESFFYPRYLTGRRLLQHEIADPSFRRQILVQYFILFQFLLNLTPASATKQLYTGGMPKTFVIDGDNQLWVKNTVSSIRDELRKMAPDGQKFEETVVALMDRERRYAQWKNEQCPEGAWEIPQLDKGSAIESAELWKRRLAPPAQYPFKLGSRSLSRLWNRGFHSIDQLKGWKRSATMQSLDEEITRIEVDEEDDKAMGNEPPAENTERKINLTWRALRLASHTELRHFVALTGKRDLHLLVKNAREANEARAAAAAAGQPEEDAEKIEEEEADVAGLKKVDGEGVEVEGAGDEAEGGEGKADVKVEEGAQAEEQLEGQGEQDQVEENAAEGEDEAPAVGEEATEVKAEESVEAAKPAPIETEESEAKESVDVAEPTAEIAEAPVVDAADAAQTEGDVEMSS